MLEFLRRHSNQLKLKNYMKPREFPAYGFHELALTIGFPDSVPDSTLPVIWARGGAKWKPLKEQT